MNTKHIILIIVLSFVLHINSNANSPQQTVLVHIVPTTENQIVLETESYIKRELRELKDIKLVDKNGDYYVSICPMLFMTNGKVSGIIVSYVLEKGSLTIHNVEIGKPEDLKKICQRIIAIFDSKMIEPNRSK